MLPLQPDSELFLQISSNLHQPNYQSIPEDLILSQPPPGPRDQKRSNNSGKILRGRKKLSASIGEKTKAGDNFKKIVHRETEKQRRQEMSTLHTTLRSLIPLQHLKGKRSMSDDINEAVNYIKHLQRKINEKGAERDELKKGSGLSRVVLDHPRDRNPSRSTSSGYSKSIGVRLCLGGIEIDFDGRSGEEALPLSKVLQVLLEERISVVNCVSTKVNDRLLHTVHAEVIFSFRSSTRDSITRLVIYHLNYDSRAMFNYQVKAPWCPDQQELQRKLDSLATSG